MATPTSAQLAASAPTATPDELDALTEILHERESEFQTDPTFEDNWAAAVPQLTERAATTDDPAEAGALHHVAQHLVEIRSDDSFQYLLDHTWAAQLRTTRELPDISSSILDLAPSEKLHWFGDLRILLRRDETFTYGDPEYGQLLAGTVEVCVTNQRLHFVDDDGRAQAIPIDDLVMVEHPGAVQRLLTPVGTITFVAQCPRTLATVLARAQHKGGHEPRPFGEEEHDCVAELVELANSDAGDFVPPAAPRRRDMPPRPLDGIWTSPVFLLEHDLGHLLREARPAQARVQVDFTGSVLLEIRHIIEEGLLGPGTCEWSPPTVFRFDALAYSSVDLFAWSSGDERYERSLLDPWDRPPDDEDQIDLDAVLNDLREAGTSIETAGRLTDVFGLALAALRGWIRAEPIHPADLARWAGHDLGKAVENEGVWVTGDSPWSSDHGEELLILDGSESIRVLTDRFDAGPSEREDLSSNRAYFRFDGDVEELTEQIWRSLHERGDG